MSNSIINIPFDPDRPPRAQIEAAIASLPPCPCEQHPHELRLVDKPYTIAHALQQLQHKYGILHADQPPRQQLEVWLAKRAEDLAELRRWYAGQGRQLSVQLEKAFEAWAIAPQFSPCLQCGLERLGIAPDEARASFDGFAVDPPALQQHLEQCRAFATAPKGVLLLLGGCGTGKTHLAIAILRELLRRGASSLAFVKHRHFLAEHWFALRPVAFGEQSSESPLARCQASSLLVYDELTAATDSRAYEDVLLDLFERRIGNFKPSIITANVSPGDLEAALGSRLYDRLRRAAFAVLEFGFESKRKSLNADYLSRARAGGASPKG
jgi:DNA replication protein DnaC